jgi:biopolymer transport protein ExbD
MNSEKGEATKTKFKGRELRPPFINVTPLIDVLLVLLIIFMVITPLKPTQFPTQTLPPRTPEVNTNPLTLVVRIHDDRRLSLNNIENIGSINDQSRLNAELARIFDERLQNRAFRDESEFMSTLTDTERVERTVFIKAPRTIDYGEVVRVIDGIKGAGAYPIGLQVDNLTN